MYKTRTGFLSSKWFNSGLIATLLLSSFIVTDIKEAHAQEPTSANSIAPLMVEPGTPEPLAMPSSSPATDVKSNPVVSTVPAIGIDKTALPTGSATDQPEIQPLATDGSSLYYYADGGRIQLTPSLNWVSVKFASDDPAAQSVALQNHADLVGSLDQARQIPNPKVTLLPLQAGLTAQTLVQGANLLRADSANFLQVNPVFQTADAEMVITDEFIATFPAGKSAEEINAINSSQGAEMVEPLLGQENTFVLRVLPTTRVDALAMANLYQENGMAITAAPNFVRILSQIDQSETATPAENQPAESQAEKVIGPLAGTNDTHYDREWFLNNTGQMGWFTTADADIDAPEAWDHYTGSSAIIIAVVDEGVDLTHEDLSGKLVTGYDATGGNSGGAPSGNDAHGTNVAGIAAATSNNSLGVAGVCQNCRIMPVRVATGYSCSTGHCWSTSDAMLADGIAWAYLNGASIINNSWGGGSPATVINTAIANAKSLGRNGKGSVVVFSAGNDNSSVSYPASLSTVIAVGASNMCDQRKTPTWDICNGWENGWGSNFGSELDVSAPGVWLYSTDIMGSAGYNAGNIFGDNGNYYSSFNGTSGAAPVVSGTAGLVLSINPSLTANQVQDILQKTADDVNGNGWDTEMGYGRVNALRAVQYALTHKAKFDFDRNGTSDVAIFRPSNGMWYVYGQFAMQYGGAGDIPVSGDYNGDGKTDVAVFRPSNGAWYVNGQFSMQYGGAGDIPVSGDYNGDGKTDVAVFRPSNGAWYVNGQFVQQYGGAGDIPVPGDYNGDGKTDVAIFRPSNGMWYVYGQFVQQYGGAGDIPAPGDYNGDGKTDVAVFRPSNGAWYVNGQFSMQYGGIGDTPVPGDYNGDGKTDVAVFRPSNGTWYVNGQFVAQYGGAGDMPIPALWTGQATTSAIYLVLTWGITPSDLDSHLWLPSAQPFHVYYSNKGLATAFPWASLDLDDTTSYGPETIGIVGFYPGKYTYAVYNYSGTASLATSGASVAVYRNGGLYHTYTVPSGGSERWWYVLDMDGTTGTIIPRNYLTTTQPGIYDLLDGIWPSKE